MRKDQTSRALEELIEQKKAEIQKLQIELGALQQALQHSAEQQLSKTGGTPRANVKETVLDLLEQVGPNGLNANIACEMAEREGRSLHVKSVSSLLSRLKQDGAVIYDGNKYILRKFGPRTPTLAPLPPSPVIREVKNSG